MLLAFQPIFQGSIMFLKAMIIKGGNNNQATILGMVQLNMPQIQCYSHFEKTIKDEIYDFNYWRTKFYMPTCEILFFHIPLSSKFIWATKTHVDWLIIDCYNCLITKFILRHLENSCNNIQNGFSHLHGSAKEFIGTTRILEIFMHLVMSC
jgi:hypothetical protein